MNEKRLPTDSLSLNKPILNLLNQMIMKKILRFLFLFCSHNCFD